MHLRSMIRAKIVSSVGTIREGAHLVRRKVIDRARKIIYKFTKPDLAVGVEFLNVDAPRALKRVVTVMTCYNQCTFTQKGVRSYFETVDGRYDHVLLLIDDCSIDRTLSWILKEGSSWRNFGYTRFKRNRGLTRSWNYGVERALRVLGADYVVIANDDVIFSKGSLSRLIDDLETAGSMAIIGPLTNSPGFCAKTQDIRLFVPGYEAHDDVEHIERVSALVAERGVLDVESYAGEVHREINGFLWAGHRDVFLKNTWKITRAQRYYFDPSNANYENEREFQLRLAVRWPEARKLVATNVFIFHYKDISQKRLSDRDGAVPENFIFRSSSPIAATPSDAGALTDVSGLLPPRNLRFCGSSFQDDVTFVETAVNDARMLVEGAGLGSSSRVLDIGCGPGRIAIGLICLLGGKCEYVGVDVAKYRIKWCQRHITPSFPNFRFLHSNVRNERYNPRGQVAGDQVRLPFEDERFDLACLFSVFTHMKEKDVEVYFGEIARLIRPGGNLFVTAFLKEGPPIVVNPEGYEPPSTGPLHRVQFDPIYFDSLWANKGLVLVKKQDWIQSQAGLWFMRVDASKVVN